MLNAVLDWLSDKLEQARYLSLELAAEFEKLNLFDWSGMVWAGIAVGVVAVTFLNSVLRHYH